MAVAAQTFSRSNLREWAFSRDVVLRTVKDHVFSHSPIVAILLGQMLGNFGNVRMKGMGKKIQTGGESVTIPVRLGKHAGSTRMSGPFGQHSVSPDDNVRLASANWKHYSGALVVSKYDIDINQGDAAIMSFLEDQTQSVLLSLVDDIGDDIFSLVAPATAITSLNDLISAASETAAVQGLSGATYSNYNARGLSARGTAPGAISFASGSFAAQGIADLRRLANNASEGMIQPNVYVTTYNVHEFYEGTVQPQERYAAPAATGDAGFKALAFRETPVLADPKSTAGTLFALRVGEDGIMMKVLGGNDFVFDDFKPGAQQETRVSELIWKGQLCIANRRYGSNKMGSITA